MTRAIIFHHRVNNGRHRRQLKKGKEQHRQKKTLEERLIEQELLYNEELADSGILYTKISVVEMRIELARKSTPFGWKTKKNQLSQLLYNRRQYERLNHTFTPAHELIHSEELKRPSPIDNKKKGGRNIFQG